MITKGRQRYDNKFRRFFKRERGFSPPNSEVEVLSHPDTVKEWTQSNIPYLLKIFQVLEVSIELHGTLTKPDKSQELCHKITFGMLSTKGLWY